MIRLLIAFTILVLSIKAPQVGADESFQPPTSYTATDKVRLRFLEKFNNQTGLENWEEFKKLRQQSYYEFQRNLEWLKSLRLTGEDLKLEKAMREFLTTLVEELVYFPDDMLMLARMIVILDDAAIPIAFDITSFMAMNWYQREYSEVDQRIILETTLSLLEWHKSVSPIVKIPWRRTARDLAKSELCLQSSGCTKKVQELLNQDDISH